MLVKAISIARFVLNEAYNSHNVENNMESKINEFEPMNVFKEVVENMEETHKSNETSDLL